MTDGVFAPAPDGHFRHHALLYRTPEEYLAGTLPFLTVGLSRDEPILVAAPPGNLKLLREALGAAADRVEMADMHDVGRNPGRILPSLLAFARAHPGRRIRYVGEPTWPGRTDLENAACVQHEALLNPALAGLPVTVFCPYDRGALAADTIENAARTHPYLTDADGDHPNSRYLDPIAFATAFNLPLPRPPERAATIPVAMPELPTLRQLVAREATAAGVRPARVTDAVTAVNELASNTLVHQDSPGQLAIWSEDGYLVCQLTDRGHIADPFAGRIPPPADAVGGRGLLIVNQLCDLVRIYTRPGRTAIRIHIATG